MKRRIVFALTIILIGSGWYLVENRCRYLNNCPSVGWNDIERTIERINDGGYIFQNIVAITKISDYNNENGPKLLTISMTFCDMNNNLKYLYINDNGIPLKLLTSLFSAFWFDDSLDNGCIFNNSSEEIIQILRSVTITPRDAMVKPLIFAKSELMDNIGYTLSGAILLIKDENTKKFNKDAIWRITYWNETYTSSIEIIMDAISGEILSHEKNAQHAVGTDLAFG